MTTRQYLCISSDRHVTLTGDCKDPRTVFRLHPVIKVVSRCFVEIKLAPLICLDCCNLHDCVRHRVLSTFGVYFVEFFTLSSRIPCASPVVCKWWGFPVVCLNTYKFGDVWNCGWILIVFGDMWWWLSFSDVCVSHDVTRPLIVRSLVSQRDEVTDSMKSFLRCIRGLVSKLVHRRPGSR